MHLQYILHEALINFKKLTTVQNSRIYFLRVSHELYSVKAFGDSNFHL